MTVEFVTDLHQQLALALQERGWTKNALVNWLDRRLPFSTRRDITCISSTLFISKALDVIAAKTGMEIEGLARAKFRLVEAFVERDRETSRHTRGERVRTGAADGLGDDGQR